MTRTFHCLATNETTEKKMNLENKAQKRVLFIILSLIHPFFVLE